MNSDSPVERNERKLQFEIHAGSDTALLTYARHGDRIRFLHTEVPEALEGKGLGSRLAKAALDYARAEHLRVVPLCPFVSSYIQRHPEYQDLVDRNAG